MAIEQNTREEMAAFSLWLQEQSEGDAASVKVWCDAQKMKVFAGLDHLKTVARFFGPHITGTQIDNAMAAFRSAEID